MFNSKIIGLGKYLPENVVTNADLEKIMETSDAWIQERTGIKERRHITKGDGNSTSVMGVKAARIAIERAGLKPQDIDFILFATLSPDYYFQVLVFWFKKDWKFQTAQLWTSVCNVLDLSML